MSQIHEVSDDDLMRDLQSGNLDAFEALVHRYRSPLKAYVAHRLGDHDLAQDLVQETFLRYTGRPGNASPWVVSEGGSILLRGISA